jgi:hypothetical protein
MFSKLLNNQRHVHVIREILWIAHNPVSQERTVLLWIREPHDCIGKAIVILSAFALVILSGCAGFKYTDKVNPVAGSEGPEESSKGVCPGG